MINYLLLFPCAARELMRPMRSMRKEGTVATVLYTAATTFEMIYDTVATVERRVRVRFFFQAVHRRWLAAAFLHGRDAIFVICFVKELFLRFRQKNVLF